MKLLSSTFINPLMPAHCVMQDVDILLLRKTIQSTWSCNKHDHVDCMVFLFLLIRYTGPSSNRQLVVHMPSEAPMLGSLAVPNRWAYNCIWFNARKVCIRFYTLTDRLIIHQHALVECRCFVARNMMKQKDINVVLFQFGQISGTLLAKTTIIWRVFLSRKSVGNYFSD